MSTVVHVNNISSQTSEQQVRDFFSFCGKITSLSVKPENGEANAPQKATVTFEKETAAKTALLLDNTTLGSSQVSVTSGASLSDISSSAGQASNLASYDGDQIPQEEKPRSRIFAEYLAHGYTLSDKALEQALALDSKHGISSRFTSTLKSYDEKYNLTDKAKAVDQSYGVTNRGLQAWAGLHTYFEKAVNTPTGQRLVDFYSKTNRQVVDIHNEARRLADLRTGKDDTLKKHNEATKSTVPGTDKTVCQCGGSEGVCGCAPGECACESCNKSKQSNLTADEITKRNEATKTTVPGTNKTVCQCAGSEGVCACAPGSCSCSGCARSNVAGDHTATGPADVVSASTGVQPLA